MAHNDININDAMDLENTNYESIISNQGKQFMEQKHNMTSNNKIETIEINSSSNNTNIEGFTSTIEGFHGEPDTKIQSQIAQMGRWMVREFSILDRLHRQYKQVQKEYDEVNDKLETTTKGYLSRTSKDNTFRESNVVFNDGSEGYVTNKGILRDYDSSETFERTHFKNKCNTKNIETDMSRDDFLDQAGSTVGGKMTMKQTDVKKIRILGNNQWIHISGLEAYDSTGENKLWPTTKKGKVNLIIHQLAITKNDYKSKKINIQVGHSGSNTKTIELPQNGMTVNPKAINKQNPRWRDTFSVRVAGKKLYVTRTDYRGGWGQNLVLSATSGGQINPYKIYLTWNGKDISEGINIDPKSLPLVQDPTFPKNLMRNMEIAALRKGLYGHCKNGLEGACGNGPRGGWGAKQGMKEINDHRGLVFSTYHAGRCDGRHKGQLYGVQRHFRAQHNRNYFYYNWGGGHVGTGKRNPKDHFWAIWNGYIKAPKTGRFDFMSYSDDGQRFTILVNGKNHGWNYVSANHGWSNNGGRYRTSVNLEKGRFYEFEAAVRECGGHANYGLQWRYPGTSGRYRWVPFDGVLFAGAKDGSVGGGNSANTKQQNTKLNFTFSNVTAPVNGFRFDNGGNDKFEVAEPFIVEYRRPDLNGLGRQMFNSERKYDRYNKLNVSEKRKISTFPFNPFIYQAQTSTGGIGWDGHKHFPLDGNSGGKWPNSVHLNQWRGQQWYEVEFDKGVGIDRIVVRNRPDCCKNRLNNAQLQLISPENSVVASFKLDGSSSQTFYTQGGPKGTACLNEGKNVNVTKLGDFGEPSFIGCYKDSRNRRMKWEGKWGTYEDCKQYAMDKHAPYFALQASNVNRDIHACMYSSDLGKTISYGEREGRCPTRPYSKKFGPVGSGWTNAVYALDGAEYKSQDKKQRNITDTINTRVGISEAKCLDLCENEGGCNAIEYDPKYKVQEGKKPLRIGGTSEERTVRYYKNRNKVIDEFFALPSYEIVTRIYIKNNHRHWRNIYFYGNNNRDRHRCLWLYPNFTHHWKLHFRLGTNRSWNDGADFAIPRQFRKTRIWLTIRHRISDAQTSNPFIEMWVNNVYCGKIGLGGRTIVQDKGKNFYINGPWYGADRKRDHIINWVELRDTYGKWTTGKCELKSGQELTQKEDSTSHIFNKLSYRPFEHGKVNLGKRGYVDEKGVLHEYPLSMLKYPREDKWGVKRNMNSWGNDLFSRVVKDMNEAKSIANSRDDVAGFVYRPAYNKRVVAGSSWFGRKTYKTIRIPNHAWFKNGNMWPVNPRGHQKYTRRLFLFYKQDTNVQVPKTCEKETVEIDSQQWGNYDKGNKMNPNFKCGLATYTDDLIENRHRLGQKVTRVANEIRKKIKLINETNEKLAPYLKEKNATITDIMDKTDVINSEIGYVNTGKIEEEGMTNLEDAYNNKILQPDNESSNALIGLMGITGLILGASYFTRR